MADLDQAGARVLHDGDAPPPGPVPLRAGPLAMLFDRGDLRYIRFGTKEVVRRIYAAVRDRNWNTIPAQLLNVRIDTGRDFFQVSYDSEHTAGEISFVWRGEIIGESDGTVQFTFQGEARTTFLKNRIGFCVLHPVRECAGQPCRVDYLDGSSRETHFPRLVAAKQPVKDMHDLRAISYKIEPGLRAEIRFSGDIFEMEDQRNWIDASFKTYCTPLCHPFPVKICAGTRIEQSVSLKLKGVAPDQQPFEGDDPVRIELALDQSKPLCPIGLGVSSFCEEYAGKTRTLLEALHLSHLRVDLSLPSPDWRQRLAQAEWESQTLGIPLEIALTLHPERDADLDAIREWAQANGIVKRWIIFTENAKSTTRDSLDLARADLGQFAPIGVGTNADFYQLNQAKPPWRAADFICWSMNPQVHAFDNLSLAETPEAIPAQIESARAFFPDKPLIVSPVTLKPRFNPVATGPDPLPKPGELPPQIDARQCSLMGAAWTLAAMKSLAESGLESVTLFETVGWRGVIERFAGPPLSSFPSVAGGPFPVYYVLRWINEFPGAHVVRSSCSDPKRVAAFTIRTDTLVRLLLANLTDRRQSLVCAGAPVAAHSCYRVIDTHGAKLAMQDPEEFLRQQKLPLVEVALTFGGQRDRLLRIGLEAHEFVAIDLES